MPRQQPDSDRALLEEAYRAFNDGDVETVTSLMADDVEWIEPDGLPFAGTYRGPAAVVEHVFEPVLEQFETLELGIDRFVGGDGTTVVLGTGHGTARETGTELASPFAHVHDVSDGRIARFVQYTDTYRWREAIGDL
jgi:hypothetical protein